MKVLESLKENNLSSENLSFVPTMGALHKGHAALVQEAKMKNEKVIVSIFVNPAQFNDKEDFLKYPKTIERDIEIASSVGADYVYIPSVEEIYPNGYESKLILQIPSLMKNLCARTRPGHFEGVMLVISRLFHLVQPKKAYFGKKDYQQYLIISEFTKSLGFPVEVIGVETVRNENGLALSSRNERLTQSGLEDATLIYRSMKIAEELFHKNKSTKVKKLQSAITEILLSSNKIKIDYVEILDPKTLDELSSIENDFFIGIAAFIEGVRLIDNYTVRYA
ncbi:MAG: pantoate--beta-alanine ligase [Leptospiraceae bacterium]|nr:pantoate--beta-alanine ligase [Leptospiraceae bacterium]